MAGVRVALLLLAVCACASTVLGKNQQFGEWLQSPTQAKASSYYPAHTEDVCLRETQAKNCRCDNGFRDSWWYYSYLYQDFEFYYYDYCNDLYYESDLACCQGGESSGGLLAGYTVGTCVWGQDELYDYWIPVDSRPGVVKRGTFSVKCQLTAGAEKCGEACTDNMILTGTGSMYGITENAYVDSLAFENADDSCTSFGDRWPNWGDDAKRQAKKGTRKPAGDGARKPDRPARNHTAHGTPGQRAGSLPPGNAFPKKRMAHHKFSRHLGRAGHKKAPAGAKPIQAKAAYDHSYDVSVQTPRVAYPVDSVGIFAGTFTVTNLAKNKKYDEGLLTFVDFWYDEEYEDGGPAPTAVTVPDGTYVASPFSLHLKFIESGEY